MYHELPDLRQNRNLSVIEEASESEGPHIKTPKAPRKSSLEQQTIR